MEKYDDTNRGVLFKNDKGDNPNRPDYTGKINVGGTEYRLSAWIKDSQSGKKFMSLAVSEIEQKAEPVQEVPQVDDECPF